MDGPGFKTDAGIPRVIDLLCRERPSLTFDEAQRVDRRLTAATAKRAPRRGSRLLAAVSVAIGMLFMMAGTGLAIGGFGTAGTATQAQYPDHPSTGLAGGGAPQPATPERQGAPPESQGVEGEESAAATLGETAGSTPSETTNVGLRQAATRGDMPFTAFATIPILVIGIALILAGAGLNRRARRAA
jgi:hypothetical protein